MKVGLFGGTFNPVHKGHVSCAVTVYNQYNLGKILFVPAKIPVHKEFTDDTGSVHRIEMLKIAIGDYSFLEVSSVEIDRAEPSYSIITVRDFQNRFPDDEFYFIMGTDSLNTFNTWRDYEKLGRMIPFIIIRRPGELIDEKMIKFIDKVYIADNEELCISSSQIRKTINLGQPVNNDMLDVRVLEYIFYKGLYRN